MAVSDFTFKKLDMYGAYLITPFVSTDQRGSLIKDYNINTFNENGINCSLKETFYTVSKKGVIRAVHFQYPQPQPKLIRCISGHIYDVIVDLRPWSPTYKKWRGFHLTGENMNELFVPDLCGHGYLVLEDSVVSYKCGEVFSPNGDTGIMYNDPEIRIRWPFEEIGGEENLIISDKDRSLMTMKEYEKMFFGEVKK